MFNKPVSQLTYDDLHDLVVIQQRSEGHTLDFKTSLGNNLDKAKLELAKDISAFANSGGGYLVFGVTDAKQIVGIDPYVSNRPVAEWLNQCINSQVDPVLFYHDPVTVPIPETDRVLVVISVPESPRKPHMVTDRFSYYVRVNDAAKPANHYQVRDMFEFARRQNDEFQAFLKKRNLDDELDDRFLRNPVADRLVNKEFSSMHPAIPLPKVLFSLIPTDLSGRKLSRPLTELKYWLNQNSQGYAPNPNQSVFSDFSYHYEPKLDGTVFIAKDGGQVASYFEILNSGFIEVGFSKTFVFAYQPDRAEQPVGILDASMLAMYQLLLLGFARRFYDYIGYQDEFLLQISFANVLNCKLDSFNAHYDTSRRYFNDDANKHNRSFKIQERLSAQQLTETAILTIVKNNSELIHNAFGLENEYCFVDGKLDNHHVWHLRYT